MRELLGLIGAFEWRKKGVEIPALGERIHPWYGVFSPVRGEYIDLVAKEPLPSGTLAFDIGTGTGVLAALLAQRGVKRVVGTDQDARALGSARANIERLGLTGDVEIIEADLFPEGRAPLVVCNPPWVPARPSSPIEHAVFDPDSRMLRGFLNGLAAHLTPDGQGWLILSDFAEHLGLRTRDELLGWIDAAGLRCLAALTSARATRRPPMPTTRSSPRARPRLRRCGDWLRSNPPSRPQSRLRSRPLHDPVSSGSSPMRLRKLLLPVMSMLSLVSPRVGPCRYPRRRRPVDHRPRRRDRHPVAQHGADVAADAWRPARAVHRARRRH
jgi:SAM-dependent methyltransferase